MKCNYCNKSIKGSTDKMMSYRINAILKHERECKSNPKNIITKQSRSNQE